MKAKITILLLLFLSANLIGQSNRIEGGLFVGAATIFGDLVENDGPSMKATDFAYGLFARRNVSNQFAIRANLMHGKFTSNDREFAYLRDRGFSASTGFTELSVQVDWHLRGQSREVAPTTFLTKFSPYGFVGGGLTFINPDTDFNVNSAKVKREKIVEDQNSDYAKTLFSIPIGIGLDFFLSDRLSIGLESGVRATFSDYLDGVSQAGNPDKNDWYALSGLHVIYRP